MNSTETLAELVAERAAVETRITDAVSEARATGATWAQIGAALGVSKQAAAQRYATAAARYFQRQMRQLRDEFRADVRPSTPVAPPAVDVPLELLDDPSAPGAGEPKVSRLWVIACGASKLDYPAPARELYSSAHFRYALSRVESHAEFVWSVGMPGQVRILSALHGLVDPDDELRPYDVKLSSRNRDQLVSKLNTQLRELPGHVMVHLYVPKAYAAAVTLAAAGLPNVTVIDHYDDGQVRGIGDQRRILAQLGTHECCGWAASGEHSPVCGP